MRVKFRVNAKYVQNNAADSREYVAGQEYDLADDHAQRWIRRGMAEEVQAVAELPAIAEPEPEPEPSPEQDIEPTAKATKKAK